MQSDEFYSELEELKNSENECINVIPSYRASTFFDFIRGVGTFVVVERGGVPKENFTRKCVCGQNCSGQKNLIVKDFVSQKLVKLERNRKNVLILVFLLLQWSAFLILIFIGENFVKLMSIGGILLIVLRDFSILRFIRANKIFLSIFPIALFVGEIYILAKIVLGRK